MDMGNKDLPVCKNCGKELSRICLSRLAAPNFTGLCQVCEKVSRRGESHYGWKGGKYKRKNGYVMVRVYPGDFYYPMAVEGGYAKEHRLVMAKHLNRCLLPWEVVHHKGIKYPIGGIENKGDNRIENLELIKGKGRHNIRIEFELKKQATIIKQLQERIKQLEGEKHE